MTQNPTQDIVMREYINFKSFNIMIPAITMRESMIKIIIPGLVAVVLDINSASKSTPPGLICCLSIKPTPIPIVIPPIMALVMIGRWTKPFSGVSQSIMVEVNANPRMALKKYDLSYRRDRRYMGILIMSMVCPTWIPQTYLINKLMPNIPPFIRWMGIINKLRPTPMQKLEKSSVTNFFMKKLPLSKSLS
jgi:hypothetical protein